MAFAAVGAVLAGGASVATTLAAVAEVGMAVSVVGAVTGSKDMMKVGGMMSLVGGVGSLVTGAISGAAAGGAAASAAEGEGGSLMSGAASAGADYANMGYEATMNAGINSATEGALSGATSGLSSMADSGVDQLGNNASNGFSIQDAMNNASDTAKNGIVNNAAAPDALAKTATSLDKNGLSIASSADPTAVQNVANSAASPMDDIAMSPDASQSMIGTVKPQVDALGAGQKMSAGSWGEKMNALGNWMEKNKTLAGAMVQVGGGVLKNAFTPDYNQQYIDLKKQELAQQQQHLNNISTAPAVGRPIIRGAMQ